MNQTAVVQNQPVDLDARSAAPMAVPESGNTAPNRALPANAKSSRVIARRYRVDGLIGEGGMARVYRGWHLPFDQPIAIKILKEEYSADKEAVARFLQEARAGALLRGKHVAQVFDIGRVEGGPPFMVTELLSGSDLQQMLLNGGPLPIDEAVQLLNRVCAALAEVHASGIVHRDLKPANIFLTEDKHGRPLIKLLDFGIAKRLDGQALNDTKAGLGSPHYMAPEQIVAPEAVDQRADIWSLGIVLFELLTGQVPFDADSVPAVCGQVLKNEPIAPSALRHDVPAALDDIVLTCLAKDASKRFQRTCELRRALGALAGSGASPRSDASELDIPVVVSVNPPEPAPNSSQPVASKQLPAWRRRTSRIFAGLALAAATFLLVQRWPPAHDLVERASSSVTRQTHEGYARASEALPGPLRQWIEHSTAKPAHSTDEPTPKVIPTPEVTPTEEAPNNTTEAVPMSTPSAPASSSSPPKAAPQPMAASRATNAASHAPRRVPRPRTRLDPIEGRYGLSPVSVAHKPRSDELLDPYPDLR